MLVTEDADCHARARNLGQLHRAGETLVSLWVIVLQADLQLDGFLPSLLALPQAVYSFTTHQSSTTYQEVPLLRILAVVEQLLDIGTHASDYASSVFRIRGRREVE